MKKLYYAPALVLTLLAAGMVAQLSCHNAGSAHWGMVYAAISDHGQQVSIVASPIPDPDSTTATIAWPGNTHDFYRREISSGGIALLDTLALSTGTDYRLKISLPAAKCSSGVSLPESTYVIEPMSGGILPLNNPVTVSWSVAPGADFYDLNAFISGYDTSGTNVYSAQVDTFTRGTSYIIPVAELSHPEAAYFSVNFHAAPMAGVMPEPHARGNFVGDMDGFLISVGQSRWRAFYVGTPGIDRQPEPPNHGAQRVLEAYRRIVTGD